MKSCVLCLLSAGILLAQPAADPKDTARKALDLLLAHKYADMLPLFAPVSRTSNPPDALAKKVEDAWGAMVSVGAAQVRPLPTSSIVSVPVKFAKAEVTYVFGVDSTGAITGIGTQVDPWKHPDYSKPDSFKERELTIGDKWKLPATLTVPNGAGPFPAVVLVHDSGQGDVDELVGMVKVFRDLAEGLASNGVAVLSYEKRTRAYPSVMQSPDYTAETEIIDDAVLALGVLRAQPEVKQSKVYALGYGWGGYLMPRIAEADGKLAGMIILNGNERPWEDLALDLAAYLGITGPQLAVIREGAAKIKALTPGDVDTQPLLGLRGPYLLDLKGYDPTGQSKLLKLPMLILQGERDFQVTMKDFAAWKSGLQGMPGVTLKSYPALDHVLVEGTGKSQTADYRKPGQHVSQTVVDDVAKWVKQ